MHPQQFISDRVINEINGFLQELYPILALDASSVYSLSYKEIKKVIQQVIQPKNKFSFISTLTKEAKFVIAESYEPSPANYKVLHDALLEYTRNFKNIYDFLAEYNLEANIPSIHGKEGAPSLTKTFIAGIPFEHGKKIQGILEGHKFSKLTDFLSDFLDC